MQAAQDAVTAKTLDSATALRIQQLEAARYRAELQVSQLLLSRSWRWTRPVRGVTGTLRRLIRLLSQPDIGTPAAAPPIHTSATRRVVHYIEHGGSQAQFPLPIVSKSILKEDRETVLVIAHEASRTGAPILAWNLVKRLNVQYNVVVLLKRGGELFSAFEGQAVAVVRLPEGVEN